MKSRSMIREDGSLSMPGQEVTWFQFLQASRLVNSQNGGWNFKRYWLGRGLDLLTSELVDVWTRNSLSKDALPKPRTSEFKLERQETKERLAAAANGKMALNQHIDGLTENQLNAAFFTMSWPSAWGKAVSYEVPLANESDGQLKIDLLGCGEDQKSCERFMSIIELKQAKNTSDSPLMGLTEAICYAIQLVRCKDKFEEESKDLKLRGCRAIRLVLAAPEKYWNHWRPKQSCGCVGSMRRIVDRVGRALSLRICLEFHSVTCSDGSIVLKSTGLD